MDRKNGSPASKVALGSFVKGTGYRRLGFLALLGTVYGVVVGSVLSTNPSAIAIVKCVVPVCAMVGIVAGVGYGFFFNISNRCTGGRLVWGIILGFGAVAVGTLLVSLLWVSIGALIGFVGGWILRLHSQQQMAGRRSVDRCSCRSHDPSWLVRSDDSRANCGLVRRSRGDCCSSVLVDVRRLRVFPATPYCSTPSSVGRMKKKLAEWLAETGCIDGASYLACRSIQRS